MGERWVSGEGLDGNSGKRLDMEKGMRKRG